MTPDPSPPSVSVRGSPTDAEVAVIVAVLRRLRRAPPRPRTPSWKLAALREAVGDGLLASPADVRSGALWSD